MAEFVGIKIDVSSLSKAFYTARKSVREAIGKALKDSGPKVLSDVKKRAPVLRGRLKTALKFSVEYKSGEASLSIVSNDSLARKYMMSREDGPQPDGVIEGNPELAFVPRFSPFWSKTATVASAKEAARKSGYKYFFRPEGSNILLGVRRQRRGKKRSWVRVGQEFAPVAIITPQVYQEGKPYIQPAFTENIPSIQQRVLDEITKIFSKE